MPTIEQQAAAYRASIGAPRIPTVRSSLDAAVRSEVRAVRRKHKAKVRARKKRRMMKQIKQSQAYAARFAQMQMQAQG